MPTPGSRGRFIVFVVALVVVCRLAVVEGINNCMVLGPCTGALQLDCGLPGRPLNPMDMLQAQQPSCYAATQVAGGVSAPATVSCPNEGLNSSVTFALVSDATCTFTATVVNTVYNCDPCPDTNPDVLLTSGAGATPGNALWRIRAFDPGFQLQPEFLCKLSGLSGNIADLAWMASGEVVLLDTNGVMFYITAQQYAALTATTNYNIACSVTQLLNLGTTSWTGLGSSFREDQLIASHSNGQVTTIQLYMQGGVVKARRLSTITKRCGPKTAASNNGGTDVTPGPDGRLYRFVARDANMQYSAASFGVTGAPDYAIDSNLTTSWYTNRMLTTSNPVWQNAGAFCTNSMVLGATSHATTYVGRVSAFWELTQAQPDTQNPDLLPHMSQVGQTVNLGADRLRVNGAAVKPVCLPPVAACSVPASCTAGGTLQLDCGMPGQTASTVEEMLMEQYPQCYADLNDEIVASTSNVECPTPGVTVSATVTPVFSPTCSFTVEVINRVTTCDPCPDANPTVLLSGGAGSQLPNGLWRIPAWAPGNNAVAPEFLCQLDGMDTSVGDIAWLASGELVVMDVWGDLYYMDADVLANLEARTDYATSSAPKCVLNKITVLDGTGWTGLGVGVKENQLIASQSTGKLVVLQLTVVSQGIMTATIVDTLTKQISPTTAATNTGGTDVTFGPGAEGKIFRWAAKDAKMPYTVTSFPYNRTTGDISTAALYTGFKVNGTESNWQNAGAFCTANEVVGVASSSAFNPLGNGRVTAFWGMPVATPRSQAPSALPAIEMIGRTIALPGDFLRVNGAAVRPTCTRV